MDSLKRPETAITLVNTAALLGASIYFYKKINNLELELNKHSEHLTTTVKKVAEMTIYKKHIMALGKAITELNQVVGTSSRDIENLKELVKFQSSQIAELQTALTKVSTADNKTDFKFVDNPYLKNLIPSYPPQVQRNNQRPSHQGQQPYHNQQSYQGQQPLTPQPYQYPQQSQQYPQQNQQYPQQPQQVPQMTQPYQVPPQSRNNYQQYQPMPVEQPPQQYLPQQQAQRYPQQGNELLNFYNEPRQAYSTTNFSDENNIDDEDTAIEAVRRAKQNNEDPLGFL